MDAPLIRIYVDRNEYRLETSVPVDMLVEEAVEQMLEILKIECRIPGGKIHYYLMDRNDGRLLKDDETFGANGVGDGDNLLLTTFGGAVDWD